MQFPDKPRCPFCPRRCIRSGKRRFFPTCGDATCCNKLIEEMRKHGRAARSAQ